MLYILARDTSIGMALSKSFSHHTMWHYTPGVYSFSNLGFVFLRLESMAADTSFDWSIAEFQTAV